MILQIPRDKIFVGERTAQIIVGLRTTHPPGVHPSHIVVLHRHGAVNQ